MKGSEELAFPPDMGLGKTVISLLVIKDLLSDSFEISKVLIMAPLRVVRDTWKEEIEKWFHFNILKYLVAADSKKERIKELNEQADIYLINRGSVDWLISRSEIPFNYDAIIIDELSSLRSHESEGFEISAKVRPKIKRIVGLTGTPSSNGSVDSWAELRLLDLGERLGRFIGQYREVYFKPDKRNGPIIYSYKLLLFAEDTIYERILDITVSIKAEDYLKMPKKINNEVFVNLSDKERGIYEILKKSPVVSIRDEDMDTVNAAVLSNRLFQTASDSVYDEDKNMIHIRDRGLDVLGGSIEGVNGKPVLITYWYRSDLKGIRDKFDAGELKTSENFKGWNQGKIPVAIIRPAFVGHGLNLQAEGLTLIWFPSTWSSELYKQANTRLYRRGQKETVVIHHILARETIDKDVMKALENKNKTQTVLIDAVKTNLES